MDVSARYEHVSKYEVSQEELHSYLVGKSSKAASGTPSESPTLVRTAKKSAYFLKPCFVLLRHSFLLCFMFISKS